MENKKLYSSIDLMKFLCAVLIVGIHTAPFENYEILDYGFSLMTRIAVPFFFVSSSFFFFRKETSTKNLFLYCKRIFILYFVWSIIYIIISFCKIKHYDSSVIFEFVKTFVIQGYKHLWFLWALIVAIVVVSLFDLYVKKEIFLILFSSVFFVIGLLMSTYSTPFFNIDGFEEIYNFVSFKIGFRNGLVYGLPFVLIGRFFAKKNTALNIKSSIIGIIFSLILLAGESFFVIKIMTTKDTILWISTLPLLFFIFAFLLKIDVKESKFLVVMRKTSVLMYCVHPAFILLFEPIALNNLLLFCVVSVMSFVFGFLIYSLSKNSKFRFLKYIQ